MPRGFRLSILLVASVGLLAMISVASARSPVAHASGSCLGKSGSRRLGYSYVTKLTFRRIGCTNARLVVRHHGGRGWHCSKKVTAKSSFQYDAIMTCNRGGRQVKWWFTQDT